MLTNIEFDKLEIENFQTFGDQKTIVNNRI